MGAGCPPGLSRLYIGGVLTGQVRGLPRADSSLRSAYPAESVQRSVLMRRGEKIPLFPLEVVLLPQTPLSLHIFEERY